MFLCEERIRELLDDCDIARVPVLFNLLVGGSEPDQLKKKEKALDIRSLAERVSSFGDEQAEGVYLRFENESCVVDRCKYRNADFEPGALDFKKNRKTNQLIDSDQR